jgi:hypothetical protein
MAAAVRADSDLRIRELLDLLRALVAFGAFVLVEWHVRSFPGESLEPANAARVLILYFRKSLEALQQMPESFKGIGLELA